jgi:hypothetical protein
LRKVLIVSPRFPPINAADLHRVRMSLPYFRELGWEPTVLCVTPETSDGIYDPLIERTVPADTRVIRVPAWSEKKCRRLDFGNLDYRALVPLYRAGSELLRREKFDLIFFSTTSFNTFLFAPRWKRRFGCPIVFDYQDPWYAGVNASYDRSNAPGGWRKYRMSLALARIFEPIAMRAADFVITVSEGYVKALRGSYGWLREDQFAVIPFPAAETDFELLSHLDVRQTSFTSTNGHRHVAYVGRGGPDMTPILRVLFKTLEELRGQDPERWNQLHFNFIGTNYSPKEKTFDLIQPTAEEHNVGDLTSERSERIPYFETLQTLRDSSAVLLIGSTAYEYTASKLFPYLLSGRPLLALLHSESLVSRIAAGSPDVRLATFESSPNEPSFYRAVREGLEWLEKQSMDRSVKKRVLGRFSARESTRQICEIFDRITFREIETL